MYDHKDRNSNNLWHNRRNNLKYDLLDKQWHNLGQNFGKYRVNQCMVYRNSRKFTPGIKLGLTGQILA